MKWGRPTPQGDERDPCHVPEVALSHTFLIDAPHEAAVLLMLDWIKGRGQQDFETSSEY